MNEDYWVRHLMDVNQHPEKYPQPKGSKCTPWLTECWKLLNAFQESRDQILKRLGHSAHYDEILEVYRELNEEYERIRTRIVREVDRKDKFPLVRGALLIRDIIEIEFRVVQFKLDPNKADESMEFLSSIASALLWDGPELSALITRIRRNLKNHIFSNIQ